MTNDDKDVDILMLNLSYIWKVLLASLCLNPEWILAFPPKHPKRYATKNQNLNTPPGTRVGTPLKETTMATKAPWASS